MAQIGDSSTHIVDYCGGTNEIVCFDRTYNFENTKIVINEDITKNFNNSLDK